MDVNRYLKKNLSFASPCVKVSLFDVNTGMTK